MVKRRCSRCGGNLYAERDLLETCMVCFQCGWRIGVGAGFVEPFEFALDDDELEVRDFRRRRSDRGHRLSHFREEERA